MVLKSTRNRKNVMITLCDCRSLTDAHVGSIS